MFQILNVWLWIGFLKWKFRLGPTYLWSNMFFTAGICSHIFATFVAQLLLVIKEGHALMSSLQKLSTSIFLTLPTCVIMRSIEMFEQLKIHFGLTTNFVPTGQFLAHELFIILFGSVLWRSSSGADDIPWTTHVFSTARKDCVGAFFFEEVQASGNFVLVFCYNQLSCIVC